MVHSSLTPPPPLSLSLCSYVVVEGGPGTTDEALRALPHGSILIPVVRTGGAAGGMFDFPPCAKPDCVDPVDWALLSDTAPPPAAVGDAVARIVKACLGARGLGGE